MDRLLLPALEAAAGEPPGRRYEVAYNPEFLREASAVEDYRAPPKIVVGERARGATRRLRGLYDGIAAPFLEVPFAVAEMAKLVDNGWHALKVAFANEIGRVCVGQGLAPGAVMEILLADTKLNLGPAYLRPGGPYGGSCLPKDVAALLALADEAGLALPLLAGTQASNRHHLDWLLALIRAKVRPPGPILQLGLSFKAGTDDLRDSPLLALAEALLADGYTLAIHDPDIDLARLTGANQALARGRAAPVLERLGAGLEGAASARLVLLGKPIPGIWARLPAGTALLDLTRLEGLA
jgi:GDP-mannose 6-dehydrogenase